MNGIKEKKFRVISWQGTVLMDLLERVQQLIGQGHVNSQTNSHMVYLKTLTKQEIPQSEIKEKVLDNSKSDNKNTNTYLLIFGLAVLAIGYWLGKRKSWHHKE